MVTEQDVLNRWNEIQSDSEKILFIVGGPGSGKSSIIRSLASDQKWEYIEAKELLSEELLEVARDQRPEVVRQMILENLEAIDSPVVCLDSVDVLFTPILNLDAIALLRELSQMFPLVVGWKGRYDGESLHLEHNNDPEYFVHAIEEPNHVLCVG